MDGMSWALKFRGGFEKNLCIWGIARPGCRNVLFLSQQRRARICTRRVWSGGGGGGACHHPVDLGGVVSPIPSPSTTLVAC